MEVKLEQPSNKPYTDVGSEVFKFPKFIFSNLEQPLNK